MTLTWYFRLAGAINASPITLQAGTMKPWFHTAQDVVGCRLCSTLWGGLRPFSPSISCQHDIPRGIPVIHLDANPLMPFFSLLVNSATRY
jgi:hypothetical protein